MKKLRTKYPIWTGVGVLLLFVLFNLAGSLPILLIQYVSPDFFGGDLYRMQLLAEILMLGLTVGLTFLLGKGSVFTHWKLRFFPALIPAAGIMAYYLYAGLSQLILTMDAPSQAPVDILIFIACMAAVGLTEELAFRGLITRIIYEKYGRSDVGVWLTLLVSGILFGAMHLVNAVGGVIPLEGVLIQALAAIALGTCLGAVYLRGMNYWAVAFFHGFMDLCALAGSGFFQTEEGLVDTIGGYSLASLISLPLYFGVAAFLLRPSKMKEISGGEACQKSDLVKLLVVLGVLGAMLGAVVAACL